MDIEMGSTTCWCGTPFSLPKQLLDSAQKAGHTIYCPHGHTVVWKETEVDRLRRERDRLKQDAARLEDERRAAEQEATISREGWDKAEREAKRLRKRASAGTCPCCQRTFSNMATHMKRQHPQFEAVNVVPLKAAAR